MSLLVARRGSLTRVGTGGAGGGGGAYTTEVNADSPVGYWRLGESSGTTATDETGNSDGTYVNSPTLGATGLVDDADTAITLDPAADSHATVPYVSAHNYGTTGAITLECVFKMDTLRDFNSVFQIGVSNQGQPIDAYVNSSGQVVVHVQGAGLTSATGALQAGVRYHFAVTYDGATVRVWVNGALLMDNPLVTSLTTGNTLYIGRRADAGSTEFDGTIDEVALYDGALTAARIKAHAAAVGIDGYPDTDLTAISGLRLWSEARFWTEGLADSTAMKFTPNYANLGDGYHLLRNPGNLPIHRTAQVNGEPAWEFNGSEVFDVANAIFSGLTAAEVFLVVKSDNDGGSSSGGHWFLGGTSGSLYPDASGDVYDSFASSTTKATGNPSTALDAWHLYNASADGSGWTSRHNGTQHYTVASNTVAWPGGIGYLGLNGSTWYLGFIAAIVMFDNILSSANRGTVENYLASAYGLTIA